MEQLADLIIERVSTLSPAIGGRTTSATFKETLLAEIEKFNGFAAEGVDPEFLRGSTAYNIGIPHGPFNPESTIEYPSADQPNVSMYPISAEGPFYATLVAPAAVDSSGGPVINVNAQILRWNGTPVEGLYGAGNCIANPGYDAYWGGGATLGNAHVWGYMAAKHAIASDEKTV
jgi:hypothetical protein